MQTEKEIQCLCRKFHYNTNEVIRKKSALPFQRLRERLSNNSFCRTLAVNAITGVTSYYWPWIVEHIHRFMK